MLASAKSIKGLPLPSPSPANQGRWRSGLTTLATMCCAIVSSVACGLFIISIHGHSVTSVPKAQDGHYWVTTQMSPSNTTSNEVTFLVDTGASMVSLTPEDAEKLGVDLTRLDFTHPVNTAQGSANAALITLSTLKIGDTQMHDVKAIVIRSGLSTSLLGMSYLGRLSRFEATPQELVLKN